MVLTDEKGETDLPGIFAIGDLRQKYANQIVIAAADGCIAALATAHFVEMRKAGTMKSGNSRRNPRRLLKLNG